MARVGFALGYGKFMDAREMAKSMKKAEDRGFEMGFFSETIELMRDSVTAIAAIGLNTTKMSLGWTQIVRLRTPVIMAQTLASLDELTQGRVYLAPGACTKGHAKVHSLDPLKPTLTLREWVESMRLLLTGEKISYHGEVIHLDDVQLGFKPFRKEIPLLIPATSTVGLKLAGKIGDGVMLNALCSDQYTVNAIKIVKAAVEDAGRDWSKFAIYKLVNCSVEDDHKKAVDRMRPELATRFKPLQFPFATRPLMTIGEPCIKEEDIPKFEEAWEKGGMDALIETIPDSYVESMTASGTPDEVLKRVQDFQDAGVQVTCLRPAGQDQVDRLLDLFASK